MKKQRARVRKTRKTSKQLVPVWIESRGFSLTPKRIIVPISSPKSDTTILHSTDTERRQNAS